MGRTRKFCRSTSCMDALLYCFLLSSAMIMSAAPMVPSESAAASASGEWRYLEPRNAPSWTFGSKTNTAPRRRHRIADNSNDSPKVIDNNGAPLIVDAEDVARDDLLRLAGERAPTKTDVDDSHGDEGSSLLLFGPTTIISSGKAVDHHQLLAPVFLEEPQDAFIVATGGKSRNRNNNHHQQMLGANTTTTTSSNTVGGSSVNSARLRCKAAHALRVYFQCSGGWGRDKHEESSLVDPVTGVRQTEAQLDVPRRAVDQYFGREAFSCRCVAWSSTGEIVSRKAAVTSAFLRKYFLQDPFSTRVELHGQVELRCQAPEGEPTPRISWLRNGRPIVTSRQHHQIITAGAIHQEQHWQEGHYPASSSSSTGSSSSGNSMGPSSAALSENGAISAFPGDFVNDDNLIVSSEGSLIVVQARLEDTANYTCVASNAAATRYSQNASLVVYVNGGWSAWSPWSPFCSTPCGKGIRRRARTCDNPPPLNGGLECQGPSTQQSPCSTKCPAVDGGWSSWSAWSSCGPNCLHHRRRTCTNPRPANGGEYCVGSDDIVGNCTGDMCLVVPAMLLGHSSRHQQQAASADPSSSSSSAGSSSSMAGGLVGMTPAATAVHRHPAGDDDGLNVGVYVAVALGVALALGGSFLVGLVCCLRNCRSSTSRRYCSGNNNNKMGQQQEKPVLVVTTQQGNSIRPPMTAVPVGSNSNGDSNKHRRLPIGISTVEEAEPMMLNTDPGRLNLGTAVMRPTHWTIRDGLLGSGIPRLVHDRQQQASGWQQHVDHQQQQQESPNNSDRLHHQRRGPAISSNCSTDQQHYFSQDDDQHRQQQHQQAGHHSPSSTSSVQQASCLCCSGPLLLTSNHGSGQHHQLLHTSGSSNSSSDEDCPSSSRQFRDVSSSSSSVPAAASGSNNITRVAAMTMTDAEVLDMMNPSCGSDVPLLLLSPSSSSSSTSSSSSCAGHNNNHQQPSSAAALHRAFHHSGDINRPLLVISAANTARSDQLMGLTVG